MRDEDAWEDADAIAATTMNQRVLFRGPWLRVAVFYPLLSFSFFFLLLRVSFLG